MIRGRKEGMEQQRPHQKLVQETEPTSVKSFPWCQKGVLKKKNQIKTNKRTQLRQKVCPYKGEGDTGSIGVHLQKLQEIKGGC